MNKISEKQLEANRENAKLGGVKTEEGKAVSKYNAIKHGLLTKEIILDDENADELFELSQGIKEFLEPIGELENILSERIITNIWRLKRCMRIEKNIMEFEKNDFRISMNSSEEQMLRQGIADMISNENMDRLLRYETSIDKGIFKAFHELQRIQAQRRGEKITTPIAIDIDVSQKE